MHFESLKKRSFALILGSILVIGLAACEDDATDDEALDEGALAPTSVTATV